MLYRIEKQRPRESIRVDIRSPAHFELSEKDIEIFLTSRLSEIVSGDHLMLIGQERSGQEEADLLALDKKGDLYIFELKRWESKPENILQVMRYGQIFGRYTYDEIQTLARRQQKLEGSLRGQHKEYFELDNALKKSQFNQDQVFVLVTNGIDADTISAVEFWSQKGIRITCSPYRIYDIENRPYIQFDTYNPDGDVIPEENTRFFIVNTNKAYMQFAWKSMLGNMNTGKASAYYGKKHSVCNIPKNSIVYLYHSGTGVVAKGSSTDSYQSVEYDGDPDAEFFVPLKFSWALPQETWHSMAVAPWEINSHLNAGHRFRQPVFVISSRMAKAIDTISREKQSQP